MASNITRYGREWHPDTEQIEIEKYEFLHAKDPEQKVVHFKNIVHFYWGPHNKRIQYIWNPWTTRMLELACRWDYLALSGCAASQKSTFAAVWGLVNWICNPRHVKVLATSTTLKNSKSRIWGKIEDYFSGAGKDDDGNSVLPGSLASSFGLIRSFDEHGNLMSQTSGIELIACESSKERENIGRLIGFHADHVILLCDEMPELSPALTAAAMSNLSVNPKFQMLSCGNFKSVYDPFGAKATPKGGWGAVDENTDEWETHDGGYCVRFDGLKSPNVLAGKDIYKGLYGVKHLDDHKHKLGEHSADFWRMCRSFPCQDADSDRIYSEADFVKGDVHSTVQWIVEPTKVAGLDVAFATGGDKPIATFGLLGMATTGKQVMQVIKTKEYKDDVRMAAKGENKSLQVAKQFAEDCMQMGVQPHNAAYDATGGGMPFGSLLSEIWSNKVYGVIFAGAPTELAGSVKDNRPSSEMFDRRASEIWFVGVDYVLSGQIKGLSREAASELVERRRKESVKGVTGLKNKVETKGEYKERTGKSPDYADSWLILLCLCREKLGFTPVGLQSKRFQRKSNAKERAKKVNSIYSKVSYAEVA